MLMNGLFEVYLNISSPEMQKIQFHKLSFWVNVFTKWAHSVGIQAFFSFRQDLCLLIGSFSTQKMCTKIIDKHLNASEAKKNLFSSVIFS